MIRANPFSVGTLCLLALACSSAPAFGPDGGGGHAGADGAPAANDAGQDQAEDATVSATDAAGDLLAADAADAADASGPSGPVLVRIAHLSPDLAPFDFCLAPSGTHDFRGPLLGDLTNPDGGGGGGVAYPQVSAYLSIDAGTYDVRLVPAGATSCGPETDDAGGAASAGLGVPDATDLPAFAPGSNVTLLVAGDLEPAGFDASLEINAIGDDAVLAGGAAVLRAVNAVPSLPAADFGLGSFAAGWLPLLTNVAFGSASTSAAPSEGIVDDNGYLFVAPLAPQALSVRATYDATADTAVATSVGIDLGSIVTVFAIGGKIGDTAHPPALLLCVDNQPADGQLADCSIAH